MRRILNVAKAVMIAAIISSLSSVVFAAGTDFIEMPAKTGVSINKPWTAKFNLDLDQNTINNTNVLVKDSKGSILKVAVSPGKDTRSIIIYPPTGGYIPGGAYSLELGSAIKSKNGINLPKVAKMAFTASKQYEDSTSYSGLPAIKDISIVEKPVLQNTRTSFKISSDYTGNVQYRVFLFKYSDEVLDNSNVGRYSNVAYTELTKGYTSSVGGLNTYEFAKTEGFAAGKYKLLVYVKTAGKQGANKDSNTDFDNYYTTYFKVLDKNIIQSVPVNSTIVYTQYNKTLEEAVKAQIPKGAPVYSETTGWMNANYGLLRYYMNPNNFLDDFGKYQFLRLNYMDVTAEDLNILLKDKGVLNSKGEVFLKAAKDNDINPIYLVSHALLESGNGTSRLATGIAVSSVNGASVETKTTYNMFGVHAYDENPDKFGSEYAYTQGWFSVDAAILGGAKFIGSNYINRAGEKQNTLYKMRWDINYLSYPHQYATDIGWARKQISRIKEMVEQCKTAKPVFEIPKFN
ncbi:beta-N-acetylglucosaminidase [Clostridium bovifaecis]|uniref:Beta-N-acetylglucosaminidase n=1 Tax=Clostridium bovifaecis TaxID=2184719 RepID=A0A6I6EJ70_9CLOT|nr:beta-N-acetylglucosaminidase [Clostridium bovifaecis]